MAQNEEVVGMVVKLAAESTDFQNQMTTLNRQMKVLQSDYKATASASKEFDNTIDGNKAKIEYLSKAIETQASIVEAHSSRVEKTKSKLSDLATAQSELKSKLDSTKQSYEAIVASQGEESEAAVKLKEELDDLQKEYDKGNNKINATVKTLDNQTINVNKATEKLNTYNNELNETKEKLDKLSSEGSKSTSVFDSIKEKMSDTASNTKVLGVSLSDLVSGFNGGQVASAALGTALGTLASAGIELAIQAFKQLVVSIGEFIKSSLDIGETFEAQMSKVEAISGSTAGDMSKLTDTAREFGAETQYSATEAAQALEYMSLAGWDAQQSSDGLSGVLNLAAASAMDLGKASDVVTDYLTAFNMEASESNHLADVMAYAMSHSNTSTEQLAEAYKNCASTATSFGMSLEDTTAWLGKMADSGIKAGEAGTTLNAILARIYGQNETATGSLQEYSIAIFDAEGKAREFTDIMKDMQVAMSNMNDEQKDAFMRNVAGTNQLSGFSVMCNTATDSVNALSEALSNSAGTSEKMAKTMNDNVAGLKKSINSKIEDIKISLFTAIEPGIKNVLNLINTGLNGITKWAAPLGNYLKALATPVSIIVSTITRIVQLIQNTLIPIIMGPLSLLTSIMNVQNNGLQSIYEIVDTICSKIEDVMDPIVNFLKNVGQEIEGIFSSLNSVKDFVIKIVDTIKVLIDQLGDKWKNLVGLMTSIQQGNAIGIVTNLNEIKSVFSDTASEIKSIWDGTAKAVNTSTNELEENATQSFNNIAEACGLGTDHVFTSFEEMYNSIQQLDDETFGQLKDSANEYFNEYSVKMDALSEYTNAQLQKEMKGWEECHENKTKNLDYYLEKAEYQAEREAAINRKVSREREKIENDYSSKLEKELQSRQKTLESYSTDTYSKDYSEFAKNEEKKTKKAKEEAEKRSKFSGSGSSFGSLISGIVKSYAVGTAFHSGGLAIVGDDTNGHGELVNMAPSSQVHSNQSSKSMLKDANRDIESLLAMTLQEIRSIKNQQKQMSYREIAMIGLNN